MSDTKKTVAFVSLGCFKNIVDTEVLGGMLQELGVEIVPPYETADWLVINTCAFIRDAKEESIDEVLEAFEKKEQGEIRHVAVMGCLPERYTEELKDNFKEADIIWGVNDPEELAELIAKGSSADYTKRDLFLYTDQHKRMITTTPNTTFIKISEGCNMQCTFCAIPQIRGPYRSRDTESIIKEAKLYHNLGFSELNLISQNSTYYGKDRQKKSELPQLLEELSKIGFTWIRVLYLMPEEVDDDIIEAFSHPTILPYFDLPFQHVAPNVLKAMKRSGSIEGKLEMIEKIRRRFPNAIIRSTFIVGFPGETEEDFQQLKDFALKAKIERIGAFPYSPEEETEAFAMQQTVDEDEAIDRREQLMDISDQNMEAFNETLVDTQQDFLPIGPCPWDTEATIGRIAGQAPEVDGATVVSVKFDDTFDIFKIKITGFENEILHGERL
jgi:ribosomal protein S12 methylthiotransferase